MSYVPAAPTPPDDGRPVSSSNSSQGPEKDTVQLSDLSVRAIALYQKQAALTDRLWSYWGTNSAFATLVALVAPVLSSNGLFPSQSVFMRALLVLAVLAYLAFTSGNRQALRVSQEALERIAAQATVASGIRLEVVKPAKALLFHKLVSTVIFAIMVVGFFLADQGRSPTLG
jgi:hypothetical protein